MTPTSYYHQFIERLDDMRQGAAHGAPLPAWRVYANTGLLACHEALAANFPGLLALLGDHAFNGLAADYVRTFPAEDARLFLYGASLPAVLFERDGPDSQTALVATLDRCWTEAHAEADAPSLRLDWVGQQRPDAFSTLRLRPAPATRWVVHASMPVMPWWTSLRERAFAQQATATGAHAVLLTRPDDTVVVQDLSMAGFAFLQACEAGLILPLALQAAEDVAPGTDMHHLLTVLFGAGALQHPDQHIERALSCSNWPIAPVY